MRLLLVEDEDPKRDHIVAFLRRSQFHFEIEMVRSVHSAIGSLRMGTPDLILLDMSLPTYDVGANEPGGRPQGFGGIEIMRYMDRFSIEAPIIVVTAYEAFYKEGKDVDLRALSDELEKEHPNTFRGLVYFNAVFEEWSHQLEHCISTCIGDGEQS